MRKNTEKILKNLLALWKPPERLKVWEWADKNRTLQRDSSAEFGRWKSSRTPYMIPIMEAFTEPNVKKIYVKGSAQIGKSELLNNIFAYIVDIDPGPILWILPTVEAAEDFSKERLSVLIETTPCLKEKVVAHKSRTSGNTITKKSFVGGRLAMVGSNSPPGLRSRPVRYIIADELDAFSASAGTEGSPEKLADKRTRTFSNSKQIYVSTPTVAERSQIEKGYISGTQEEWRIQCPDCGEWHFITFEDIRFESNAYTVGKDTKYEVKDIFCICKSCGAAHTEATMKRQPGKMVAMNPRAIEEGIRSFRLNAFVSPWETWDNIIREFLYARNDPERLQVVVNTLFGEVWEDRGDMETEEALLERREVYDAELPDGVLVLTCGVDTQDNRLEGEIRGWGHFNQSWGIKKFIVMGRPDDDETWRQLDDILDHTYRFKDGIGLKISVTFIDEQGHFCQDVRQQCRTRMSKKLFAIAGSNNHNAPLTAPPKKQKIVVDNQFLGTCWRYELGVSSAKQIIMDNLKVKEPGSRYCHFPLRDDYGPAYFAGLLSERLAYLKNKKQPWQWVKLPGHSRNEALDCFVYALAAFRTLSVDLDAIDQRLKMARKELPKPPVAESVSLPRKEPGRKKGALERLYQDW